MRLGLLMLALHWLAATPSGAAEINSRVPSALHNTFVKLTRDKKLKIVVVGNSVTHGAPAGGAQNRSFYGAMAQWFQARFPDAQIEVQPRIIFAIGPEIQLFRMDENVVTAKPDLVLVEFGAANGAWGEAGRPITERATEGYIRRLRFLLPQADCIMQMGLFKTMMDEYRKGQTPASVSFQRSVAAHYGCALSDAQAELARRILAGEPWETTMKDAIHPSARGYEVHSQTIVAELERQFALFGATPAAERGLRDHPFPAATVHPDPWLFPRLVPAFYAENLDGFQLGESGALKFLAAQKPLASGSFRPPRGRIVGVLMRSPQQRGNLEVRDGERWIRLSQKNEPRFTEASDPANFLQRNFFAAYGMPLYSDKIEFRVSPTPEVLDAHVVQIVGFLVIEREPHIALARP